MDLIKDNAARTAQQVRRQNRAKSFSSQQQTAQVSNKTTKQIDLVNLNHRATLIVGAQTNWNLRYKNLELERIILVNKQKDFEKELSANNLTIDWKSMKISRKDKE